jgi:preprotein translocase subunit SecA
MDYLQEGIGLRAYSQKDPLVEYQREGYELFNAMMDGIKEESVGYLFHVDVHVDQNQPVEGEIVRIDGAPDELAEAVAVESVTPAIESEGAPIITAKGLGPARPTKLEYSAPSIDGEAGIVRTEEEFDEIPEVGPDASRAERRRAERAMRKRDDKKR